ncbi:unnamed protein product [Eruca vesicaria subsp. sativa]|uniref:DUF220 domain-containing protein n=1 Tax=Eruca vesicaria subsp. sativa TaxID=29727 RepID=A0ABC8LI53_ERUVS|nr:unnamed protein product [Eruca vesicaria subsp. sativa]
MGIFPRFGAWINENIEQPRKSQNVESKKGREMKSHEDRDDTKEQLKLWREAEKEKQWLDPSPKVTKQNISRRFTANGKRKGRSVTADKVLAWKFRRWSRTIPIRVNSILEPKRPIDVHYKIEKKYMMRFMEKFEVSCSLEPMYVDSKHLCKNMKPKNREEYKECSGGQGKIGTKVELEQVFKPSFIFNYPPVSWYIRWLTVKTMKDVARDFQSRAAVIRAAEIPQSGNNRFLPFWY